MAGTDRAKWLAPTAQNDVNFDGGGSKCDTLKHLKSREDSITVWRKVKDNNRPNPPPLSGFIGFAMLCLCVVGLASSFAALIAVIASDFVGGGILLIAAALSFGLLLNGIIRS